MKPLRLALDTNIWLDWLVFEDLSVIPIKDMVKVGGAEIFISTSCEQELQRALAYSFGPKTIDIARQAVCLAQCRQVAQMLNGETSSDGISRRHLPLCRDPDDQKFLELAYDSRADYLITKDLALLALDLHHAPRVPFRIIKAQQFRAMSCAPLSQLV
jgi:uncharacterized protein